MKGVQGYKGRATGEREQGEGGAKGRRGNRGGGEVQKRECKKGFKKKRAKKR